MYFIYFAKSIKNKKVYVGFTSKKPEERIKEHNLGSNKWSSGNGPFKLIYFEYFICEQDARYKERYYKTGVGKRVKYAIISEFSKDP